MASATPNGHPSTAEPSAATSGAGATPAHVGPPRGSFARVRWLYRAHVVETNRENALLVALAFLTTFGVVRFITHSIRSHRLTFLFHNVQSNSGPHIHHMVFGIIGLIVVGYITTAFYPERRWARAALAIAFGVSAALTLDEFAIWLNVKDVYWEQQGRESVDAALIFAALATLGAAGRGFIRELWHDLRGIVRDTAHACGIGR
jgi:hypothetical protein